MVKQTEQEKASAAMKVEPGKNRFTAEEALQEGADRMALRYGKKTRAEILEDRAERADAAAEAAEKRAAAIKADAEDDGSTTPPAKKTAAKKASMPAPTSDPDGANGTDAPATSGD
jgi:hypothetical protein